MMLDLSLLPLSVVMKGRMTTKMKRNHSKLVYLVLSYQRRNIAEFCISLNEKRVQNACPIMNVDRMKVEKVEVECVTGEDRAQKVLVHQDVGPALDHTKDVDLVIPEAVVGIVIIDDEVDQDLVMVAGHAQVLTGLYFGIVGMILHAGHPHFGTNPPQGRDRLAVTMTTCWKYDLVCRSLKRNASK
ncbi:hypothetical protein KIN20_029936 [Parelaphostrongylus tenuis]|uniref:Uncharacterized protein n=1 Tax=Parelaphostrongylus tenuis TaxID=148309 RepID=A0AAD5R3Y7_PARTN|nr:hypothetical protein KIN20_029936 [Parelaphostrongylus tenuis]